MKWGCPFCDKEIEETSSYLMMVVMNKHIVEYHIEEVTDILLKKYKKDIQKLILCNGLVNIISVQESKKM